MLALKCYAVELICTAALQTARDPFVADILKAAINGDGLLPLWVSFPVLLFAAGLFLFSPRNIRRKWVL